MHGVVALVYQHCTLSFVVLLRIMHIIFSAMLLLLVASLMTVKWCQSNEGLSVYVVSASTVLLPVRACTFLQHAHVPPCTLQSPTYRVADGFYLLCCECQQPFGVLVAVA